MIAADIHGKNHHRVGSIGKHIEHLRLYLADGDIVTCSRQQNPELFEATLGGMGLTGIILSARIKLIPVTSAYVRQRVVKTSNVDETLELFSGQDNAAYYSVAWIDCLAPAPANGRSLFFCGEHAAPADLSSRLRATPFKYSHRRGISVPFEAPSGLLNGWSIRLFNALYYRLNRSVEQLIDYERFFFPLDTLGHWNRLYGPSGFLQYQCLLPIKATEKGLKRILEIIAQTRNGSFLAVLKRLGPGGRYLSFPEEGYTITLDFPIGAKSQTLLPKLDTVVRDNGGRIYLAKDARAPRDLIEKGYPDIELFRDLRRRIDPQFKWRSLLSERLGL
jgi:FAD/FMN-containing dehydrogenase